MKVSGIAAVVQCSEEIRGGNLIVFIAGVLRGEIEAILIWKVPRLNSQCIGDCQMGDIMTRGQYLKIY